MKLTPARRHFEKVMAHRRGRTETDPVAMTAYEQMLSRLHHDRTQLSAVQSLHTRATMKQEMLPAYDAWINGVLETDSGTADEVLVTVMVWHLDAGNYDRALQLGQYVLRHGLSLPDSYHRTPATLLVDEICNPTLTALNAGQQPGATQATLETLMHITEGHDMPDEVSAKLRKTQAYLLLRSGDKSDPQRALTLLQEALMLHDGVGVKKDIEMLTRQLTAKADTPQTEAGTKTKATAKTATGTTKKTTGKAGTTKAKSGKKTTPRQTP
ncbi:terminase [Escherichia coli]|nr:terminase [Escherichia coli]